MVISDAHYITETFLYKSDPDVHLTFSENGGNLGSESKS